MYVPGLNTGKFLAVLLKKKYTSVIVCVVFGREDHVRWEAGCVDKHCI